MCSSKSLLAIVKEESPYRISDLTVCTQLDQFSIHLLTHSTCAGSGQWKDRFTLIIVVADLIDILYFFVDGSL